MGYFKETSEAAIGHVVDRKAAEDHFIPEATMQNVTSHRGGGLDMWRYRCYSGKQRIALRSPI